MLHVYELTGDTFAVSMVAVVGLVPMIIAGLYGGMLADAFDRRLVALIAASVTFVSTLLLAILAWSGHESVGWLFALSAVNSAANSIVGATKSAITPRLLPRELLPSAAALQGITVGITVMTFGHPIALFPAIGAVLLGGGPITTGALTASIAAGAFASSLFSGPIGRYRWHGIGIQRSIQVFGMATAVFGLVLAAGALGWFAPERVDESHANIALIVLAMITLAVTGAADNVSELYRSTMMQAAVPDTMRGRLQGVFMVGVAGGPRVGALYAGTLATLTALWVPSLVGGLVIVALVGVLVRLNPGFRAYDAEHPTP